MSDKVFPIFLFGFEFVDMMILVLIALWVISILGLKLSVSNGKLLETLIMGFTVVLWLAGLFLMCIYGRGDF